MSDTHYSHSRVVDVARTLVHGVASHFRVRATAWFTAFLVLNVGIILRSGDLSETQGLMYLERLGTLGTWSVACMVAGSIQIAALVINGSFPQLQQTPYVRAFISTFSTVVWIQLAMGAISSPLKIGSAVYPMLVLIELYNVAVAAIEMRDIDHGRGDG